MANREKINTVAMAIAKLQAPGNIALATGCELAKIPAVDALEIADLLERLTAEALASAQNVGKMQTEIVRCKDCIYRPKAVEGRHGTYYEFPYEGKCPCQCDDDWYSWSPDDDWFCADGKRKVTEDG